MHPYRGFQFSQVVRRQSPREMRLAADWPHSVIHPHSMKHQTESFRIVLTLTAVLAAVPLAVGALSLGKKKKNRDQTNTRKQAKEIVWGELGATDGTNVRGKVFAARLREKMEKNFEIAAPEGWDALHMLMEMVAGEVQGILIDGLANAPEGMTLAQIHARTRPVGDDRTVDHYLNDFAEAEIVLSDRDMFIRGPNMDKAVVAIECLRCTVAEMRAEKRKPPSESGP